MSYLRQIILLKIDPKLENYAVPGFTKEEKEKIKKQAESFNEKDLRLALKLFLRAESEIKFSSIPQLPLELAIIESLKKEEE